MARAFLVLTSRPPAPAEMDALKELHALQITRFSADPATTFSVAGTPQPELAALTIVCSTLLTSDAALTNR